MPRVPNQPLALFSIVVLLCEMQGPGGVRVRMRSGEAEDAVPEAGGGAGAALPGQCQPSGKVAELAQSSPKPGQPLATAQFLLKPVGFCSCQRHRSSPATGRTEVREDRGQCTACQEGDALTHLVQAKGSFPAQLPLGQRGVSVAGGHVSFPPCCNPVLDLHKSSTVGSKAALGDQGGLWEQLPLCLYSSALTSFPEAFSMARTICSTE